MKMKLFILILVVSIMGCIGCGSKSVSKEETTTSDVTIDLQGKDAEIEMLSQQVADLKIAVKDMQDIVNTTTKVESSNIRNQTENQKENQKEQENSSYEQYVNVKFPKTEGKTYSVRSDNKVKFYKDIYCTQELTDIPDFLSSNADSGTAPNGLNIYAFRTVNDEIIYSSQRPIIVEKEN